MYSFGHYEVHAICIVLIITIHHKTSRRYGTWRLLNSLSFGLVHHKYPNYTIFKKYCHRGLVAENNLYRLAGRLSAPTLRSCK